MLKIISLYTLQQIFEKEALSKITATAKMCYISCLTHHFDGLPANLEAMAGFDIQIRDVNNYGKLFNSFVELQDAGLVKINDTSITFYNHWHKYVDKAKVERASPAEYLGMMNWQPAAVYKEELLKNDVMYDLLGMQKKGSEKLVNEKLDAFMKEQAAVKKHYPSLTECTKHFINWFNKRVSLEIKNSLKSTNKLIG